MMIHPSMSMAIAEAKRDDLVREVRTHPSGRGTSHPERRADALSEPRRVGLGQRLGHAVRWLHRNRAAEPAA